LYSNSNICYILAAAPTTAASSVALPPSPEENNGQNVPEWAGIMWRQSLSCKLKMKLKLNLEAAPFRYGLIECRQLREA